MEGKNSDIEVISVDRWNARILTLIVYGIVGRIAWESAQEHMTTTLKVETLSFEMAWTYYGAFMIAGVIMLILLPLLARPFHQVMALQRMMIESIWSLFKGGSRK